MKLFDGIKKIQSNGHYLTKPSATYDSYIKNLNILLNKLESKISQKKLKEILGEKLQLDLNKFNEHQFIQAACELTAMSPFLEMDNANFCYERKINSVKDVDFSILIKDVRFNIEVKCPSFKETARVDDEIQITFINRAPTKEAKEKIQADLAARLSSHGKRINELKNLDNTLKDFLISTHEKVNKSPTEDINILLIGCDDAINMHTWRHYLFGHGGFFTQASHIQHEEFDRVDFILLTNIYNRHHKYFESPKITNHWNLKSSFNILYHNQFSKRNKSIPFENGFDLISPIINNKSREFEAYLQDKNDLPKGESDHIKQLTLGVSFYTDKFKNSGVFYFK